MKKRGLIYLLIIVLVLAGVFYKINSSRGTRLTEVKTSNVSKGDIQAYLSTTATVKSQNSVEYFGLQGKVKTVHVNVGNIVAKGDTLITYESQDYSTGVKQAQIQYDNAILQKKDLENQNKAIKDKIAEIDKQIKTLETTGNPQDIAKIETLKQQKNSMQPISNEKLKQSENAVALAKLSLDSAKQKMAENKTSVIAENNGVVTELNATVGGMTSGAQPVVVVQDIENLQAVVALGKYDANKVKLGQAVIINSEENNYTGQVSFIDPAATKTMSASGGETTLGIKINILEKKPNLKIDFDVDVDILLGEAKNVIKVPAESIRPGKGDKFYLYTVENGIVKEHEVLLGLQSDLEVEVKSGISEKDKVILNPSASIREGIKVKEAVEGK